MYSTDLTPEQLEKLKAPLTPYRRYTSNLKARMGARGFPDGDPLAVLARQADDAVDRLALHLRELFDKAALPEWAGGKMPRERKPRRRRARPN